MNSPYLLPYGPFMAQPAGNGFVTGFVAGGCISAFQDTTPPASPVQAKRVLRHALQGGTALAAGQQAAAALRRGDYGGALMATAAGAAGVLLLERLLRDIAAHPLEKDDGKEA